MSTTLRSLAAGWIIALLPAVSLWAANVDHRLADAVKSRDKDAVRSLLKERLDVNAPQPDGATALAWAVYWDDLETTEQLIGVGAKVNVANDYGVTPLLLACNNRNTAMIEKLLKAGANPNVALNTGRTALMTAARDGNADAVKSLLIHGADVNAKELRRGQTALMWAVAEKHPEIAGMLIEYGADVNGHSQNGFTPLMFAARQGDVDSTRILLQAGAKVNEVAPEEGNALVVASAGGHEALSIILLERGADPNQADRYGITALHYAMGRGLTEIASISNGPTRPNMPDLIKTLLAHGANPNAPIVQTPCFTCSESGAKKMSLVGATPFFLAAAAGDSSLMRALLAKGADPKSGTNQGVTPSMAAAGYGQRKDRAGDEKKAALEALELTVELGGDVNAANEEGLTAVHSAACTGADAIVQFLADKGAKVNVKSKFGETPLDMAEGHLPIDVFGKTTGDGCKPHPTTANLLRKLIDAPRAQSLDLASASAN